MEGKSLNAPGPARRLKQQPRRVESNRFGAGRPGLPET